MVLIGDIVEEIRQQLQLYFNTGATDPNASLPDDVTLANISLLDAFNANDPNIRDKLVISLVSIEEEKALRYARTTTVIPAPNPNDSRVITHHPIIYLNLYLLFSSHNKEYKVSLNQLSAVVNFFQHKHVFTGADIALPDNLDKVVFELCTTSFEQMNHLWGVLGGKYVPSALYKVRILPHADIRDNGSGARILRERANSQAGS
ncbi:MAG: DUF4255 domain-containing protein [Bacteroidota bacterium]